MADNFDFIKKLEGHSGCSLNLLKMDDLFFVRKFSSSLNYNTRLKKQCIKQYKFNFQNVLAPKIFKYGIENDCFYFDMEFIQGKTLSEYFSSILITEIADFIRLFFLNIQNQDNFLNPKANIVFKKKIDDLKSIIKPTENVRMSIKLLESFDWSYAYKSPCHGDLTLENIIITPDKKLYLIDFLDSFYDSWLIDLAKLLQDLYLGWSFRNMKNDTNRNLRLLIAKESVFEEIGKMKNSENIVETVYALLLLNVLRIYPYTKDEKTFIFLENSIKKILNILEPIKQGVAV